MAAVFLAVRADDEYRKEVAVKLVQPGLDSRDLLNRFRNERQTLAGLDHPNIVKLLDGGSTAEGLPFLVMDYVEGSPIDEYCDQHKLSIDERLHLFDKVCAAVQYAHQRMVIHRDLKPSNILVVADGTPKLLDFGIAKVLKPQPSAQGLLVTQTGTRCMTPAYASPEQMRGKSVTPATDIYSLGVVLYELLTGHRPYRLTQHTPAEIERAICEQEPENPSTAVSREESVTSSDGRPITKTPELVSQTREGQPDKLRRRLRGDLDNIVLKALQKEPKRRYGSVEELAVDIDRHLQHLPVKARPSTLAYGVSKFVQRHKTEVSAALIVLLMLATLLAGLAFVGLRWRRQGPSKEPAERQLTANPLDDYVTGAAISPDGKYVAYQDQTGFYLRSTDSGETHPITVPAELRNRIDHLCWFPDGEKLLADVEGSNGGLDTWVITILGGAESYLLYRHGVATGISPDGRMIAFTTGELGRQWKEVWVGGTNGEAPRKLVTAEEQEQLTSPVWSPDGRWIAYGRIWKTAQGSWSSDIEVRPASGGAAKTLVAESSLSESNTLSLGANPWFVGSWSPDGRVLFTVAEDATSQSARTKYSLWQVRVDPRTGEAAGKPGPLTQWSEFAPRDLTMTSDGKHLALLKERLWLDVYLGDLAPDGVSMKAPRRLTLDDRGSKASAWTRDGQAILFGSSRNGRQEIFRQGLNENVAEMVVSSPGDVYGGKMSPDGSWFLYWKSESARPGGGTSADSVRLMRRAVGRGSPEMPLQLRLDPYGLDDFWCSSNPQASSPCVLGLLEGKDLIFYSLDPIRGKGSQLGKIEVFGAYMGWGLSPDGSRIAVVDGDKYEERIEVLTLSDGSWHEVAPEPGARHLQSIAWAADGKSFFATSYAPNSYNLLHVTLAGKVQSLLHNEWRQWLVSPLPSPDGKYLAFRAQTSDSNVWMIESF
jgi:Tol biopolymer transport system component